VSTIKSKGFIVLPKNKILLFIKTPPPVNGATIMNQIVEDNHLIKENFFVRSIPIHYVSDIKDFGKISYDKILKVINVLFKLIYELIFHRPDLVYFQVSPKGFAFLRDFMFSLIIKIRKVNILYHLHGKGIQDEAKNNLKKILYRLLFNNSKVICLSGMLTDDIREVYSGNPFVVNNGIPVNNLPIKKDTINLEFKVIYLSNLYESKGIKIFLDSLKILKEKKKKFKAVIIGKEADWTKSKINDFCLNNNLLKNVEYLGAQYGEAKKEILDKIDVFVFPTFYANEAFPLVILEAMQLGLPVISTFEGAIPEIVDDGLTGFLVKQQDELDLAEKIETLLRDKELRIKMGEAGRKKFEENYTLEIFEKNMHNVFDSVLKENDKY